MEEVTTSVLRAGAVGAPASFGYSLPLKGRNDDRDRIVGKSSLKERAM
jgi:hypothetical protein